MSHPAPPRAARRSGFTLVEIVSAVALLSIGLLAILTATRAARDTQQKAVHLSIARAIAQSKLDQVRATPFDSIPSMAGVSTDTALPTGNQIVVTTAKYPDASETNLYQVTVTVSWTSAQGARTIRYDTLITRK